MVVIFTALDEKTEWNCRNLSQLLSLLFMAILLSASNCMPNCKQLEPIFVVHPFLLNLRSEAWIMKNFQVFVALS